MRVLDIGCAKGFLLKDLMIECPGLECFGIDISEYAIKNCEPEVKDRLQLGTAKSLPFANDSFELVISINTIHNLERAEAKQALSEIQRVSKSNSYVVVDSFNTPEEKEIFEKWVLTAKFYGYPSDWLTLFEEAGYTGDYSWTIIN
jgi:ubiquinone/menaquinone biosynthesis C-methylase UbiE